MARSAEALKDSSACMALSKAFTAVRWTLQNRDLQGLVAAAVGNSIGPAHLSYD